MNLQAILDYLAALERNNDRDWFHAHQPAYKEAVAAFEELVRRLLLAVREFDDGIPLAEPKELTFKLMRDTRFSNDKSPYNPSFRAHMGPQGKLPIPVGYYLMLRPGGRTFLGGGLFADMFKDATARIRQAIAENGGEWQRIVDAPGFTELFTVGGTALQKVPAGFDPAHPQAQYLKHKSWYLEFPVPDERLTEGDFIAYAAGVFTKMKPFHDFLNRALDGFQMPTR